ncbi:MAG TPA: cation:proton antiporter [Edaphobacter sp.]|nr:cation:proton antiporter [Edaphobacter sp.]
MTLLLVQVSVVLLVSLIFGTAARRLGQARVIGEMMGGIALGPSFLGRYAPHTFSHLFPQQSMGFFDALSTVGLILFLFLIGSELDYEHLRTQRRTATLASLASIVLPFVLAALTSPLLYSRFASAGVPKLPFLMFLGIATSITAFPVLARILEERQLQSTPLGATAMMCAAVDDVTAWSLLALTMTLLPAGDSSISLSQRFLWLGIYLSVMLFGVRPAGLWLARHSQTIGLSYGLLGAILVVVFASSAATDAIGVHPLFGAFLAGLCFPRIRIWQESMRSRLEVIVSLVLLPLFFAVTGLRTRLDLLSGLNVWVWTGVILLVAVLGKAGGAVAAAKATGHDWRDSFALGILLNTRGLVELIVLNIAYSAHIFSATLFTMFVVMALVTTMMTVPILNMLKVGSSAGGLFPSKTARTSQDRP